MQKMLVRLREAREEYTFLNIWTLDSKILLKMSKINYKFTIINILFSIPSLFTLNNLLKKISYINQLFKENGDLKYWRDFKTCCINGGN